MVKIGKQQRGRQLEISGIYRPFHTFLSTDSSESDGGKH